MYGLKMNYFEDWLIKYVVQPCNIEWQIHNCSENVEIMLTFRYFCFFSDSLAFVSSWFLCLLMLILFCLLDLHIKYIYFVVCYHVIAAPCVRSVGCVLHTFTLLLMNQNALGLWAVFTTHSYFLWGRVSVSSGLLLVFTLLFGCLWCYGKRYFFLCIHL